MANVAKEKILDALKQLDPSIPEHWTDDGLPVTKVVQAFASDLTIKRSDITEVAPGFSRETAQADAAPLAASTETIVEAAPGPRSDPVTGVLLADDDLGEEGAVSPELRARMEQAVLDAADRKVEAATNLLAAQKEVGDATRAHDAARLEIQRKFPPLSAAENIKDYLASEFGKRAAAAGVHVPSQLDRVMAGRKAPLGWASNVRQRGRMVPVAAA